MHIKNHCPLSVILTRKVPANVVGDAMRLGQVLSHFLNNALKFARQGRIIINVYLLNEFASTIWVRFDVIDNGIGLSSEAKQQNLQSFSPNQMRLQDRNILGSGLSLIDLL
jgi:signal transduction histidine kinase